MKKIIAWMRKHPQRTAGLIQVASGSLLSSLPTLGLNARTLAVLLTLFGLVQAVFGFLKSQQDVPPDTHDDGTAASGDDAEFRP